MKLDYNRIWNELSEESKKELKLFYFCSSLKSYGTFEVDVLDKIFGKENISDPLDDDYLPGFFEE